VEPPPRTATWRDIVQPHILARFRTALLLLTIGLIVSQPSARRRLCGRGDALETRGAACVLSYLTPTALKLSWC
jgi:hypothetical protein